MAVAALPVLSSDDGLTQYLQEIRKFPLLTPEEENRLGRQWREEGDVAAAHRLVTSHLRLVAKIAMGFRGYGMPMADLIAEGNIGLMQAVKRFEPERGLRLATYAMWWIRASIQEYILSSWSLVKLGSTAAYKRMFFNLSKIRRRLQMADGADLGAEGARRIAAELDLSPEEVTEIGGRLSGRDASLNTPLGDSLDRQWQDMLPDEGADQEVRLAEAEERDQRRGWLVAAMAELDARERHIITERRLKDEPVTLEELAAQYGLSRERIRQLENRAFAKLQKAITAQAAALPALA